MTDWKTNASECAFPHHLGNYEEPGMTKREYFAAMALQGLLSSVRWQFVRPDNFWEPMGPTYSALVEDAADLANQILKKLGEAE